MNIQRELNIDWLFDNILTSYENRMQKIQTACQSSENITESSHFLFDNVHNSLVNLKKKREILNSRLCETLTKNGSINKINYNIMMSDVLSAIDEKEKEAENRFLNFIEAQTQTANLLKTCLLDIKDVNTTDSNDKIAFIKNQLSQISLEQEKSKQTVIKTFMDFQQMHSQLMECLENMLDISDILLIQEIKKMRKLILNGIN